ncbi:hypothetical protein HPB47_014778, partial [Ixodes persulcatus]
MAIQTQPAWQCFEAILFALRTSTSFVGTVPHFCRGRKRTHPFRDLSPIKAGVASAIPAKT